MFKHRYKKRFNKKSVSTKKHVKYRRRGLNGGLSLLLLIVVFAILLSFITLDKKIFPIAVQIANLNMRTRINTALNDSLLLVSKDMGVESSDFYIKNIDSEGKITSFSANTMLINDFCSELSVNLSERLSIREPDKIQVPLGSLIGIKSLANLGPKYTIDVLQKGNATVDFETSFVSEGINQINFQIWLNIESKSQIINPMQSKEIIVNRKISLVNTIITGDVPTGGINNFQQPIKEQ